MITMNKLMVACAMIPVAVAASAQAVVITGVTSATAIDPAGGSTISYTNPNWSSAFTKISTGSETYSTRNAAQMLATPGVQVLNFESANGFTATNVYNMGSGTNGAVFTSGISPYTTDDAITGITLASGYQIGLSVNNYNTATKTLSGAVSGAGVFLVGDNSASPVMTSGTQGLTFGSAASNRGITLTFQTDVSALSLVFNSGNSGSSPTYLVVYFDVDGNALASYQLGAGNGVAVNVGLTSSAANIRSVWIGLTNNTSNTGIVIDDVAFVPVPEPATAGIVLGGVAAAGLLRKVKR